MNILLAGGSCSLVDSLILKLRKEGHRVYILTGDKYRHNKYKKVFEKYEFPYDSENLGEIVQSVNPDVTILMGAFDTNYSWNEAEQETVRFTSHLMNILVALSAAKKGKVIFLSSDEVYSGDYRDEIIEETPTSSAGLRADTIAQAEEICDNFRRKRNLDVVVLRLDHLYSIPRDKKDINNICARMCLDCMRNGYIEANEKHTFSLLYEDDAVEFIYQVVKNKLHEKFLYQLSSDHVVSELELASMVQKAMNSTANVITISGDISRCVLSGKCFEKEYGVHAFAKPDEIIEKMAAYMLKHKAVFVEEDQLQLSWWQKLWNKWKWLLSVLVPFAENLICFIPFFMLNNRTVGSRYFANLDPFLLYVLLFAIIYGQQQATFSAILAVAGYMFRQMYTRSGLEILLDYNTYVWVAQLFILGLVVGYMRDQIRTMRMESQELEEHLSRQIADIKDINESNVRVKGVMEQQLIDHKDSIGKIYSITSKLDQYMPDEVIFYAVEMLTKLMQTKDAAIYNVVNKDYARVFSASSKKARSLGNSIRYKDMMEVYEALSEKRVYINKRMNDQYPQMACAIFEDDEIQMIIMLWGLSWEKMTLGQANFLTVVSYMIQNAVLRAQRYIQALEAQRYKEGSRILSPEAFEPLVQAYMNAETRNLAECVLLKICISPDRQMEIDEKMTSHLRDSDYLGMMTDGNLYVLLANTTRANAVFVQERFDRNGYNTEVVENIAVCHKE